MGHCLLTLPLSYMRNIDITHLNKNALESSLIYNWKGVLQQKSLKNTVLPEVQTLYHLQKAGQTQERLGEICWGGNPLWGAMSLPWLPVGQIPSSTDGLGRQARQHSMCMSPVTSGIHFIQKRTQLLATAMVTSPSKWIDK